MKQAQFPSHAHHLQLILNQVWVYLRTEVWHVTGSGWKQVVWMDGVVPLDRNN